MTEVASTPRITLAPFVDVREQQCGTSLLHFGPGIYADRTSQD